MTVSINFREILTLLWSIVGCGCCLLWAPLVFVTADPDFDFGGSEPKICKPYTCSKGYSPVQKWPLSFKSKGCSSMGGGISMHSPGIGGDGNNVHESCCDQRAACFQTCGAIKTVCDEEFQRCTKKICSESDDEAQCNKGASIFSVLINFDNCETYGADQYSHCECVASEDATGRREDLLRKFYKKFSPESVEKARDLAKKADTSRKMANLMGKLVKKYYPRTIQKLKDPRREKIEKLMKEGEAESAREEEAADEGEEDLDEDEAVQEL